MLSFFALGRIPRSRDFVARDRARGRLHFTDHKTSLRIGGYERYVGLYTHLMFEPQPRAISPALCAHRVAASSSTAPGQKRCEKKGP